MRWEIESVREAAREAVSAATRNGGEWYVGKLANGRFVRGAVRCMARDVTPLLAVRVEWPLSGPRVVTRRLLPR